VLGCNKKLVASWEKLNFDSKIEDKAECKIILCIFISLIFCYENDEVMDCVRIDFLQYWSIFSLAFPLLIMGEAGGRKRPLV